ncbi:DNA cytosine methyltransferase [Lelliottia jeotgali]|nr:DNA cytosine methyltransferase [Lelliottia jeotgali]
MEKSKQLRKCMTPEELHLWYLLRGRRFYGFKFRRQMPIGSYIVDFSCFEARLIVELDGGQHQDDYEYDLRRTAFLNASGWRVIRFWNNEFRTNEEGVLGAILDGLSRLVPSPQPSPCTVRGHGRQVFGDIVNTI